MQIDSDNEVGIYTPQADCSVTTETSAYWSDRDDHIVTAWYPATDGSTGLSDQSQKFIYMRGTGKGNYGTVVTLTFTHSLTKVRVTPTDILPTNVHVQMLGLYTDTGCEYAQGSIGKGSDIGWVEMKPCEYEIGGETVTCSWWRT